MPKRQQFFGSAGFADPQRTFKPNHAYISKRLFKFCLHVSGNFLNTFLLCLKRNINLLYSQKSYSAMTRSCQNTGLETSPKSKASDFSQIRCLRFETGLVTQFYYLGLCLQIIFELLLLKPATFVKKICRQICRL